MEYGKDTAVCVVVRTRNRPALLSRALDDILAQTVSDWTLVVVNDGGDRGLVDALCAERETAFAGRCMVIHNDRSAGMEAASNQGVRARESEFIAIHDDDDTWHPEFLSRTVEVLRGGIEVAVAVRTQIIWERIVSGDVEELSREIFLPHLDSITLADLLHFNTSVPISILYRRSALAAVGGFDESLPVVGDWECNLRLAASGPIAFVDDVLANWHQRPSASGDLGNSVVALGALHRAQDRIVRDRALRSYVQRNGIGLPLYLAKLSDQRVDELRRRIDEVQSAVDNTLARRMRRRVGRFAFWRGQ